MHPLPKVLHTVGLSAHLVAFVRKLMGKPGWNVTLSDHSCGPTAIRTLEHACATLSQVPSLVLLDIRQDMAGGLSLVRWIKGNERCQWVPVVVICGDALWSHADSASRRGINGIVVCDHRRDTETSVIEKTCRFWLRTNITAHPRWVHSSVGRDRVDGCDVRSAPRMPVA